MKPASIKFNLLSPTGLVVIGAFLALWIYSSGLSGPFFFDDFSNIVDNEYVQIQALSFESILSSLKGLEAGPLGRPVSVISFALTHYWFGLNPFAFKAINLALHLSNALLVFFFTKLVLHVAPQLKASDFTNKWLPVWVSLAWLLHPIQVVPVLLSVQRMTLLATFFLLCALIIYLRCRTTTNQVKRVAFYCLVFLVFWPLSVFSKETGLLLPVYILAIEYFCRRSASGEYKFKTASIFAALLIAIIITISLYLLGWGWLDSAYNSRPFTLSERLLTEARVLWLYAQQIVIPSLSSFGLYLDDIPISQSLWLPISTLTGIVAWLFVCTVAVILRKRYSVLSFGVIWFVAGHTLESTFLPLEIAHEYRNYLPSFGLITALAAVLFTILDKYSFAQNKFVRLGLLTLPLLYFVSLTYMRNTNMSDPLLHAVVEASNHPASARANYSAARALVEAGYGGPGDDLMGERIKSYLLTSVAHDREFKLGYLGLMVWACASQRPVDAAWLEQFAFRLRTETYAIADHELPYQLLDIFQRMPTCLTEDQALNLFNAGANNKRIYHVSRAKFLAAAADYLNNVAHNPALANTYREKALALHPTIYGTGNTNSPK